MRRTVEIIAAITVAATSALTGCTESSLPTQPVDEPAFFDEEPAQGFTVVLRNVPLADELSVTRNLGPKGGELAIPAAGIRVLIPEGALTSPTKITLLARAGSAMAFELAPGGLELEAVATFELDMSGTTVEHLVAGTAPGSPVDDVLGLTFEDPFEGGVEPVGILRPIRSESDHTMIVETMTLLAGYATASG